MDIEVEVSVFFGFLYVYKWVGVRYDFHAEDVGKDFRFFYAGFGVPMCVGSQVTVPGVFSYERCGSFFDNAEGGGRCDDGAVVFCGRCCDPPLDVYE